MTSEMKLIIANLTKSDVPFTASPPDVRKGSAFATTPFRFPEAMPQNSFEA
jgi:hypothetical protein